MKFNLFICIVFFSSFSYSSYQYVTVLDELDDAWSFVFFAISWGAVIGLYINYTNLHEDKFKKLMIGLLIFSLTFTVITF